ncbi:gamma-glutamylcyclotransferase family protein [Spirosoma aerolatum]|uniref:gamma-glutamylcyclotransferase family protein n=1 Tax=Spirosoma aerolatum TaxID=1211326 RepID=UPI0009AEAE5F|nr:gamma-glutamylcyclotransferase family protein [Spirosoma aerolatum]
MTSTPEFLIVYGTLRSPFDNHFAQYLRQRGRYIGEGKFRGQAFDMGSYPGAIYDEASQGYVHGTVFNIGHQKESILTYLDYYEGVGDDFEQPTEFIRAVIPVEVNNALIDCWIYLYNLPTTEKPLIVSGDYAQYIGNPYKPV